MYIGRHKIGLVQRAAAKKCHLFADTCVGIVTPKNGVAPLAVMNDLSFAAGARAASDLQCGCAGLYPVPLYQRVDREGGASFPLTPTAVAAMHNQRRRHDAVTGLATGTPTGGERIDTNHLDSRLYSSLD